MCAKNRDAHSGRALGLVTARMVGERATLQATACLTPLIKGGCALENPVQFAAAVAQIAPLDYTIGLEIRHPFPTPA